VVWAGYAEAAKKVHEYGVDKLLIADIFANELFADWTIEK